MLVTVLFLGPRLAEAVEMLERSRKGSDRSYLVIHYHPSLVTVQYNLAKVRSTTNVLKHFINPEQQIRVLIVVFKMLFPPCTDPLMKRDLEDVNCLYSPNKLAKVTETFTKTI